MQTRFRAWLPATCVLFAAMVATSAIPRVLRAQSTGTLTGRVIASESGQPIGGAHIEVGGSATTADATGAFSLSVAAGTYQAVIAAPGHESLTRDVRVVAGAMTAISVELDVAAFSLDELVVTTSREERRKAETAATIGVVSNETIEQTHATHPADLLNQVAGVWVSVTNGEGHMTSIRQPKTTNPVYLYLENGVPTRSTGFFNHNALYEVNVAQAERIEVVKGPMTALYGSDAIGGMVNVLTRSPSDVPGLSASFEAGGHGYQRALVAASLGRAGNGVLGEVNLTRTDGWRNGTGYDRGSGTLTWERGLSPTSRLRTVAAFSAIDQQTAGSSALSPEDFRTDPELNYTPISYRDVRAFRASSAFERIGESSALEITGFARWNDMEMLPNWSLTYDPAISETGHASAGALLRYRRDLPIISGSATFGTDLEYSPGHHREWQVAATRVDGIFTDYVRGAALYDYDVAFSTVSPYLQVVSSPIDALHITAGLRLDHFGYDYDNALSVLQEGSHRRPASTRVTYTHLSPKIGASYELSPAFNVFAAYGRGFRAPSEGQLFRQGRAVNTVELEPVKADNVEVGVRAHVLGVALEASAYRLTKDDDILAFTNADGSTENVNAGETLHRGIELSAAAAVGRLADVTVGYTRARHTYDEWLPRTDVDYSGNEMEDAPHSLLNATFDVSPAFLGGGRVGIEWSHVGGYWMDPANTRRYDGHDLLHLRAQQPLLAGVALFARVHNLTDERYAESAGFTTARGEEFAPGMPRTLYIGAEWSGGGR